MWLLVTRPEPDNARTAAALRARGHQVMLAPLLQIQPVEAADLGPPPFAGVLLTSANGARAAAAHPRRGELRLLPVLAVGRSSADAARAAGFSDVASADGDARDLARLAAAHFAGSTSPLLYLAGEDRSRDFTGDLASAGIVVRTVVVYRAAQASVLPNDVRMALRGNRIDGVLHFSRRSAEAYVECSRGLGAAAVAPAHYCLSAGTAEPLRHAGAARIHIAAHPDEASLLDLVASRFG
jgi:uroporphyrinogen-III synthase